MELIVDRIFNTFYFKNANISIKEKMMAIGLGLIPFLAVLLYFLS